MAYVPGNIIGDGVEDTFTVPFPFVRKSYVVVKVDDVDATFTWPTSSTVTIAPVPPDLSVIDITRETPLDDRIVDFINGAGLPEQDLDDSFDQLFQALEEIVFLAILGMGKDGGHWDAINLRIQNVADAISNDEAPNLGQIAASQVASAVSAAAALASENAAQSSEDDAQVSEDAAQSSEDAAAASAAALPTIVGGDADKFLTINAGEDGYDKETPQVIADLLYKLSLQNNTLFAELQAEMVDVGFASSVDVNNMTGLTIPGTPDGVKKYAVSGRVTGHIHMDYVELFIGATGDKGDTRIVKLWSADGNSRDHAAWADYEFVPGASDTKFGVAVKFDGSSDNVIVDGTYVYIRQVT